MVSPRKKVQSTSISEMKHLTSIRCQPAEALALPEAPPGRMHFDGRRLILVELRRGPRPVGCWWPGWRMKGREQWHLVGGWMDLAGLTGRHFPDASLQTTAARDTCSVGGLCVATVARQASAGNSLWASARALRSQSVNQHSWVWWLRDCRSTLTTRIQFTVNSFSSNSIHIHLVRIQFIYEYMCVIQKPIYTFSPSFSLSLSLSSSVCVTKFMMKPVGELVRSASDSPPPPPRASVRRRRCSMQHSASESR